MDDAEIAIVVLNSTAGTTKATVDALRAKGVKAGLVKPRVFRPFPVDEIADALKNCKAVAVMDKADSLNAAGGPLFEEVVSAMFVKGVTSPKVINYIYGLGGRDVKTDDIEVVYNRLIDIASTGNVGEVFNHLGVRE
jgi:pyruvate ferredoxin oxidoreductase alpha subunit